MIAMLLLLLESNDRLLVKRECNEGQIEMEMGVFLLHAAVGRCSSVAVAGCDVWPTHFVIDLAILPTPFLYIVSLN